MGALLPLSNPVRIAEEYALIDTLSGGRLVAALLRGEIAAPTSILSRTDKPEDGQMYKRRIPNSYRMYVYGAAAACDALANLITEFIQRGDAFVVATP
jgi:hypothetical protein